VRHSDDHRGENALGVSRAIHSRSMNKSSYSDVLARIQAALEEAKLVFSRYTPGESAAEYKAGHDPVTQADKELDAVLRKHLLRAGEGWLSEESVDDLSRLRHERVWVVDPLDGTREFVAGIPEFCVSIAFVERGKAVAGGICNPATAEVFLGSPDSGITYNGAAAQASRRSNLCGATVLASRSETKRGEWEAFQSAPFKIHAVGSVAYKLARVAAGLADATFTLSPKHEWDIAAGVALVLSAGGHVQLLDGSELICHREQTLVSGLVACGPLLKDELLKFLSSYLQPSATH
jgi:myo-inositol-1(or 4)-monophosphatase